MSFSMKIKRVSISLALLCAFLVPTPSHAVVDPAYLTPGDYYVNIKDDYIRAWVVIDLDSLQAYPSTYWNNLFLKIIVRNETDSKKPLDLKDIKINVQTLEGKTYTNINYTDLDVKNILKPVLFSNQKGTFLAQYALDSKVDKVPFTKINIKSIQLVIGENTIPLKKYTQTTPIRLQKLVDLETYLTSRIKELEEKEKLFKRTLARLDNNITMLKNEIRGLKGKIKNLKGNLYKVKLDELGGRTVGDLIRDYRSTVRALKKNRAALNKLQNDYDNLDKEKKKSVKESQARLDSMKKELGLKITTLEAEVKKLKKQLKSRYSFMTVFIAFVIGFIISMVLMIVVKSRKKPRPSSVASATTAT